MNDDTPITKADLTALEDRIITRVAAGIAEATQQLKDYVDERSHDVETRLLRAFSDYQEADTTRFRHMKADLGNLNVASDERLAAIERRLSEIDRRLILKNI